MAEFTPEEVELALREFLPQHIRASYSVDGYRNDAAITAQVLAVVTNVLLRDANAPYLLRSIAAKKVLADATAARRTAQDLTESLLGVWNTTAVVSPAEADLSAVDTALDALDANLTSGSVGAGALAAVDSAASAMLLSLAEVVRGDAGRAQAQVAVAAFGTLRDQAWALGRTLDRLVAVETEFRSLDIRPLLLAHLSAAVHALMDEIRAVVARGRDAYAAEARGFLLRLAAARSAILHAGVAAYTPNTTVLEHTPATVLEHREWGRGPMGRSESDVPAVVEGTAGVVMRGGVFLESSTGFTEDYEGDEHDGAAPLVVRLQGRGPHSFWLEPGVLLDVSWQPGSSVMDADVTLLLDHDGAGSLVSAGGPDVISGTIDYVTGEVRDLVVDADLVDAEVTVVYRAKANTRTNYFRDTAVNFITAGVVAGHILEILVGGGPEDPSGEGYLDRYRVLQRVNATTLKVSRFGASDTDGGLPEPYTAFSYRVVDVTASAYFGSRDAADAEFMWFKVRAAAGAPGTTSGTPWVGFTDPDDNALTGLGAEVSGTPLRTEVLSGDTGWYGPTSDLRDQFYDHNNVLLALPYLAEAGYDEGTGEYAVDGLWSLVIYEPEDAIGVYPISHVKAAAQNFTAGWCLHLESEIPEFFTQVTNFPCGDVSETGQVTFEFVLDPGFVETDSLELFMDPPQVDFEASANTNFAPLSNLTGAHVVAGYLDMATGEGWITYDAPPSVGSQLRASYHTLTATYAVVPNSRLMVDGAAAPQEVCSRVEFAAADLINSYEADPENYPGPGDFAWCATLRPHLFRIAALLDAEVMLLAPVRYSAVTDAHPLEYNALTGQLPAEAADFRFFRARPGASGVDDVHDEYAEPHTFAAYQQLGLTWCNTTNIFRSTDYAGWDPEDEDNRVLHGWERLSLWHGTVDERRVTMVTPLASSAVQIDAWISDQLGNDNGGDDVPFALEDIVRQGDILQVPLDSGWPEFYPIVEVISGTELRLGRRVDTHISDHYANGMSYRILRSLAPTAVLDITEDLDLAGKTLLSRGPLGEDPNGIDAETVPPPGTGLVGAPGVRPNLVFDLWVDGEVLSVGVDRILPGAKKLVLADAVLPPWRRRLPWSLRRTAPVVSPLLNTTDAVGASFPGDRVCFWATSLAEVPSGEAPQLPLVVDATLDAVPRVPLVAAPVSGYTLRLDRGLPRFAAGDVLTQRGEASLGPRDAMLLQKLTRPALVDDDFRILAQRLNEVRIQGASDEVSVLVYAGVPQQRLDADGGLVALRNDPGPPAESWLDDGVEVGHLAYVTWEAPGYPDVEQALYITAVTARELSLSPRPRPEASDLGYPAVYRVGALRVVQNDVTLLLQTLWTYIEQLDDLVAVLEAYLSNRGPADEEQRAGLLRLLSDAGMDRAKRLLLEGRIEEFFSLTADGASYSARALTAAGILGVVL